MRNTWISKTFSSAMAPVALVMLALLLAPSAAQAEEPYVCFPTCSRVDGRMLSVAGVAGNGLVQEIVLRVAVSADDPDIEIDVFDADTGTTWDSPGGTDAVLFELFADPNGDGTGTTSILGPVDGNTLAGADNNWVNIVSMPNSPLALAPSGNYVYRLLVSLSAPTGSSWSNFKVRTRGVVSTATLTPIPGIFALTAPLFFNPLEIPAIYPNAAFFEIEPTNFDGTVNLFVDFPNDASFFEFFEGDSDRGRGDGTDLDTNDPNSDDLAVPPFAVGTNARPEGVAFVDSCTTEVSATACPADDRSDVFFQRSPSIQIRLVTPTGEEFLESNPSGELEWERIRLSNSPVLDPSVDDFVTSSIPAGLYQVRLEGIDLSNLNAFSFSEEVIGLCQGLDTPCRRSLRSFRLGDTVFLDLNGDGVQQSPTEPGIGGVIMDLRGSAGSLLGSRVTDANGNYTFEVAAGTYTVEVAAENFTPPGAGGVVGDRVWLDIDGDAIDSGEPGLSNVRVELVDTVNGVAGDADDKVIGSMLTDVNGNYIFAGLPAGTYFTRVIESTVASGLALSGGGSNPSPMRTILASGACSEPDCLDLDFPYTSGDPATAVAGDYVWFDANGDGLQGADEVGFTGVTMQLINTTTGRITDMTTTNGGFYLFTGLIPGDTYVITVTDHADVLTTFTATSPVTSPSSAPFTPAAGDVLLDKDFGYTTGSSATIADRVWADDNQNGLLDGTETGIAGVTVNLLDFAGSVVATTSTVVDGSFAFANLPTGLYSVVVSDLTDLTNGRLPTTTESLQGLEIVLGGGGAGGESFGYAPVSTGALEGLTGTTIKAPNANVDVQTDAVPVGDPAGNNVDFDFGYRAALGSIGDRVWHDTNEDGVQDAGEVGLNDVVVELVDNTNTVLATRTTAGDGDYLFEDLEAGDYSVRVDASTLPSNFAQTFDLDGLLSPNAATVTLTIAEDRRDVDFGYDECAPCAGKVSQLSLVYLGAQMDAEIQVLGKRGPNTDELFNETLQPGEVFDLTGPLTGNPGFSGTLGTTIEIYVNGVLHTTIHTSCSVPIGPGLVSGDFQVVSGSSKHGGLLCPVGGDGGGGNDCVPILVRDDFDTVTFDNNDGTSDWAAGWIENDTLAGGAGPSAGQVQIHDSLLTLDDQPNTGGQPSIAREVDLSGATNATLRFKYLTSSGVDRSDAVTVEVSNDGGANWTKLKKITGITGAVTRTKEFDISSFISEQTQIRFRVSKYYGGQNEFFCLSFVEIETDCTDCQAVDVIDDFEVEAFDNNDGPDSWSSAWIENDPAYNGQGPWAGQVQIHDGLITLHDYPNTGGQPSIARQVDLSAASTATLSFDFYTSGGVDYDDAVTVEVSNDGGATWTTLEVITGISGAASGIRDIDISSFASAETQVRFQVSNKYGGSNELFCLGFVRITASC